MDEDAQRAGLVVSGAMHLALLAILVFGFARAPSFDDAPESVPVETITTTQLNEIMEGEKTGKPAPAAPAPLPPTRPDPAPPTPPQPPKPEPAKPEPPAPQPPPRPEPPPPPATEPPPAPEPPKRPEPPKPVAEDAPSPPSRPRLEKPEKPEETPRPPERTRVAKLEEPPKPTERPRPEPEETPKPDKFKPDEIAKALSKEKSDDKPRPKSPAFDPSAISKLIGQSKTAEISPHQATPLGLANHHAARMSVSLENALNEWFRDSYKNCWNLPPSNPAGENYVFDVRVTFNPDGSLAGKPVMLNPPHDPEWQAHADSVMRAVMRCNPLRVPSQYSPFFDQWRSKTIHFDPASAEG